MLLFWAGGVKAASHITENRGGKVLELTGDAERRQNGALIIPRKKKRQKEAEAWLKGASAELVLAWNFLLKAIIGSWRCVSHDLLFPVSELNLRANATFV